MAQNEQSGGQNKRPGHNVSDPFQPKGPRDGYDNTGTQGYDSLKDDGYKGSLKKPSNEDRDGTGSSSEDFHKVPKEKHESDEDRALDKGI